MDAFDPLSLLETLTRHGVRFVVIGGYASFLQAAPFLTHDLDITPEQSLANLERLSAALTELGAQVRSEGVDQPLPFAHRLHVDSRVFLRDAELRAAIKIGRHLRAMNKVLARQTGHVGARAADPSFLHHRDFLALFAQAPREVFAAFATAQNDEIEFFRLRESASHRSNKFNPLFGGWQLHRIRSSSAKSAANPPRRFALRAARPQARDRR